MAMQPVTGRKPRLRVISARSASHALAGPEKAYPVYQFSNRVFIERPGHNPFSGIFIPPPVGDDGDNAWGNAFGDAFGDAWDV